MSPGIPVLKWVIWIGSFWVCIFGIDLRFFHVASSRVLSIQIECCRSQYVFKVLNWHIYPFSLDHYFFESEVSEGWGMLP